ncbi:hypothetical protein [Methanolobus sp. WCC4]|uniref:hypothetical protein n=1 Tax=Methanolobus sp. WCC4 TaxID=3125784 RepID=UPI0030FC5231
MRTETMIIYIGIAIVLMGMSAVPSAAQEPVQEPINVCILVSPDTIMLGSNSPMFGIEVEVYDNITLAEIVGLVDVYPPTIDNIKELFPEPYDVTDIYDSNVGTQNIILGVIVKGNYGQPFEIVDEFNESIEGKVVIDVDNRKDYEISPHSGRLVMQYKRNDVFNFVIGYKDNSSGDEVTVGDLLEYTCVNEEIGRVAFFIRGTFDDGVYTDREFYGYNYADVMLGGGSGGNHGGGNH